MATVCDLNKVGQAVWIEEMSREMIESGKLKGLIEDKGVSGVTFNPRIFEKTIGKAKYYDNVIAKRVHEGTTEVKALYESIVIEDIQMAADALHKTFERSGRSNGFVSIGINPHYSRDLEHTILDARRLWRAIKRENIMITVPGTKEGLPAIRQLLAEGMNVNVTLLFSVDRYLEVMNAYAEGIEGLQKSGGDLSRTMGVASFFVSRIDTVADREMEAKIMEEPDAERAGILSGIMGTIAISNARIALARYNDFLHSKRWLKLAAKGAMPQRLLWASTSTKNPKYRDVKYVEELAADLTINTMPVKTLRAFIDHGSVQITTDEKRVEAEGKLQLLDDCGISLAEMAENLLDDEIKSFSDSYDKLLRKIDRKKKSILRQGYGSEYSNILAP